jgi:hypothetical protein
MSSLVKDYITLDDLKKIDLATNKTGGFSRAIKWVLKTPITQIRSLLENNNKWSNVWQEIGYGYHAQTKCKNEFFLIVKTYIDKDIINRFNIRNKKMVQELGKIQGKNNNKITYEELKKRANNKNYDISWTEQDFKKNYKSCSESNIPLTDQLCGHDCNILCSLNHLRKVYKLESLPTQPSAFMCKYKCRYKLNHYNKILSYIKGLNIIIAPFKNYILMKIENWKWESKFINILQLPCGHYLSLSEKQMYNLNNIKKNGENIVNGREILKKSVFQTDPLKKKEERLIRLCNFCNSDEDPNHMCLKCWKIKKNDDFSKGSSTCKQCINNWNHEYRKNRPFEKVIYDLVKSKYTDPRVKSGRIKCTITDEIIMQLWEKQKGICALSGIEMNWKIHNNNLISIDRIDSINGNYVEGEIQLTCCVVNFMKQQLSDEKLIEWCDKIALYRGNAGRRIKELEKENAHLKELEKENARLKELLKENKLN